MSDPSVPAEMPSAGTVRPQSWSFARFLRPASLRSRAWWVTGGYALFATLWILFSDRALHALIRQPEMLIQISVYKGLGFVTVTSLMLLFTMRRTFGVIEDGYHSLKAHETEIERLKRLYAALSHINQAIVWTKSREELFQMICRVLVEHGGFRIAWIGWYNPETQEIESQARYGHEDDRFPSVKVYSDDRPEGRGPTGRAFREGHPVVCNDFMHDPATKPWREEGRYRGVRASAAFQICLKDRPAGTLSVYAGEAGYFQDREVALLTEAARDISFAMDNLVREDERCQAEALADSERRFSDAMIESTPGVLYMYNEQGRFLRWNQNFELVSGYTREEVAGMHPLDFFAKEDKQPVEQRIAEVFTSGEACLEVPLLAKDGRTSPFFFTGKRIMFGESRCLVGVGIDISQRKEMELALKKSEQRYRSVLDNMLEGCQLLDFDLRYLYLNGAASVQNRRPNSELLGNRMPDVWPGIFQTRLFALILRCIHDGEPFHEEAEFVFPDGASGWFDVRGQAVPEGVFLLSIDITERHEAEKALRELNQSLELKVAERTTELHIALVRAESADRLKSAFLATMSHELRTPMNSIIGFTGILLQGLAGPLNAEQSKQLGMVRGSARHLLELINDVLDLSKIEAGQLEVHAAPFDLPAAVARVSATVQPLADTKGLSLTTVVSPELGEMVSDQRRVVQILINLVNNAIKFTDKGSVSLVVERIEDFQPAPSVPPRPAVCISVVDTGIGIKARDMGGLFQPFVQVDTGLTRQHEGTGLGLAICRRLATLLGGEISATSEWSKGSTFTVLLPLQQPT